MAGALYSELPPPEEAHARNPFAAPRVRCVRRQGRLRFRREERRWLSRSRSEVAVSGGYDEDSRAITGHAGEGEEVPGGVRAARRSRNRKPLRRRPQGGQETRSAQHP